MIEDLKVGGGAAYILLYLYGAGLAESRVPRFVFTAIGSRSLREARYFSTVLRDVEGVRTERRHWAGLKPPYLAARQFLRFVGVS